MGDNIDFISAISSAELRELDTAVASILGSETILDHNAGAVEEATRSVIRDPSPLLRDVVGFALSSDAGLSMISSVYDEKELWIRLFLRDAGNYSLRLHIWLPSPDGTVAIETAHSHRRYLISYVLSNRYTSYDYQVGHDNTITSVSEREIGAGTCYLIKPETVHAISNQTEKHTVTLIVRGGAVRNQIHFFDDGTRSLRAYSGQRPIGNIGRTDSEQAMDRKAYLGYRLRRLVSEADSLSVAQFASSSGEPG